MTTFKFKKKMEDIEEPALLDVGWYPVTVSKEPTVRPNEKLREAVPGENPSEKDLQAACKKDPRAGFTFFADVIVLSSEDEIAGRRLTIMMPFPSDADQERRDRDGMLVYDAKMQRIAELSKACGNEAEGDEFPVNMGQEVQVYVKKRRKRNREELENVIDIFAGFKAIGDEVEGLEGLELGDEDLV